MAAVNASRSKMAKNVVQATKGAKLIGFNGDGEACVWFGGYTFNVFDAARDWEEVRMFTSGKMASLTDYETDEAYGYAKTRMLSEGFKIVE
jgi:hypothetical protein